MRLTVSFHLAILLGLLGLPCLAADSMDCVRAKPKALLESASTTIVKNYSFLSTSQQEAKESFVLPSGIPVNIFHSGCENFVLELHFSITDEGYPLSNTTYWLQKASALLSEVKKYGKTNHITSIQRGISQAIKVGGYKYTQPIETIEGYEYNYFQVVSAPSNKYELIITHVVAL